MVFWNVMPSDLVDRDKHIRKSVTSIFEVLRTPDFLEDLNLDIYSYSIMTASVV
jgi:hypothetical protein